MSNKLFVQFTAGRGPVECAVACFKISQSFVRHVRSNKIEVDIADVEEDDIAGFRSATIELINVDEDTVSKLKSEWEGTIKFISTKNPWRPEHKRKNWYVGCNFFEFADTNITFNMNDVNIDNMRASGPGGQNVNKVESAVRLTHIPTGISVKCDCLRDRSQNLKTAKEILQAKLNALNKMNERDKKNAFWLSHDNLERGNEVMTIKGELSPY